MNFGQRPDRKDSCGVLPDAVVFVWNKAQELEKKAYEENGKRLGYYKLAEMLKEWKRKRRQSFLQKLIPRYSSSLWLISTGPTKTSLHNEPGSRVTRRRADMTPFVTLKVSSWMRNTAAYGSLKLAGYAITTASCKRNNQAGDCFSLCWKMVCFHPDGTRGADSCSSIEICHRH